MRLNTRYSLDRNTKIRTLSDKYIPYELVINSKESAKVKEVHLKSESPSDRGYDWMVPTVTSEKQCEYNNNDVSRSVLVLFVNQVDIVFLI